MLFGSATGWWVGRAVNWLLIVITASILCCFACWIYRDSCSVSSSAFPIFASIRARQVFFPVLITRSPSGRSLGFVFSLLTKLTSVQASKVALLPIRRGCNKFCVLSHATDPRRGKIGRAHV